MNRFQSMYLCIVFLFQKNPGTIRTAEEDRGRENYQMDLFVDVPRSGVISKHIATLCSEAKDATYTRRTDLNRWASQPGKLCFFVVYIYILLMNYYTSIILFIFDSLA